MRYYFGRYLLVAEDESSPPRFRFLGFRARPKVASARDPTSRPRWGTTKSSFFPWILILMLILILVLVLVKTYSSILLSTLSRARCHVTSRAKSSIFSTSNRSLHPSNLSFQSSIAPIIIILYLSNTSIPLPAQGLTSQALPSRSCPCGRCDNPYHPTAGGDIIVCLEPSNRRPRIRASPSLSGIPDGTAFASCHASFLSRCLS